jgi:pyruvate/2-oxoglutarate dehydrogenase complex dihydrolipoamide dehydrogenase (E3) component
MHPLVTMQPEFDLVVLGAGSGGLTAARFAADLGARVALVEANRIGGDCTWTGCVPSKALIKAAKRIHEARRAGELGLSVQGDRADMARVRAYVQSAIERVYVGERPELWEARGVALIHGRGIFEDAHTLRVGERALTFAKAVICTGSHPRASDITGLDQVPHLTYETLFEHPHLPEHLVIVGGGPIGLEMAQAYRRLGAAVTVVATTLLPSEEPSVREVLGRVLGREGVEHVVARATAVERTRGGVRVHAGERVVDGDTLLVATGRRPNVEGLGLDRAGVRGDEHGIEVDDRLRTSASHIYAAGDVLGGPQFTHLAGYHAFHAARNALLPGSASASSRPLPAVTFLDPEVARVGLSEAAARARFGESLGVHRVELADTDRAIVDDETEGFIQLVTKPGGVLVGATIVAPRAGEMISEVAVAVARGLSLSDLANVIHPYPTWSTALQQLASSAAVADFVGSRTGRVAMALCGLGPTARKTRRT